MAVHIVTFRRLRALTFALMCAALPAVSIASPTYSEDPDSVAAALAAAKAAHEPVFVDFSALWCHACWWMKTNVMHGERWNGLMRRVVYVEADSDSADGAMWMEKLHVAGLPTYVVLNADGSERGRVVGETKSDEFYPKVERFISGADTLDELKRRSIEGSTADIAAVLDAYAARNDNAAALSWYKKLPSAILDRAGRDDKVVLNLEAMRMDIDKRQFASAKDSKAKAASADRCVAHGHRALASSPGFDDLAQIIDGLSDCSANMPAARRKEIFGSALARATEQLDARKLSIQPLPPGTREAVIYLAEATKSLGDADAGAAIYARGIAAYRKQMATADGSLDLKKDRSASDDLYALYRFADEKDSVRALLKQLADTYGDDCNYALAYGSLLLKEQHAAEALVYLEHAAASAHGRYVLRVATARAKALLALSRESEAKVVVADALRQSGSGFPKDQAALRKVIEINPEAKKAGA